MVYCPKCGAVNDDQATFCQKCGGRIVIPQQPASEPVKRAPAVWNQTPFDRTFRGGGPLLKSFLGLIFVLLVMEIFGALSGESAFAGNFADFLGDTLLLFFLMFLLGFFFGYYNRKYPRESAIVSPLVTAIIVTFVLWVVSNVFTLLGESQSDDFLTVMGDMVSSVLYIIFLLILLLGYIGVIMKAGSFGVPPPNVNVPPAPPAAAPQPAPYAPRKRMGRSNRDKIIFGVCGGMAEYLDTDPFLVRVLWVVGTLLTSGVLILVYVILAMIMPKYP
ncbi:MAG TPA: PspC domain-containing protein [Methanomassiliicoccales archaeon]|nr:PspC domain-containing protein [Methanomassiliicoccales archaeon]